MGWNGSHAAGTRNILAGATSLLTHVLLKPAVTTFVLSRPQNTTALFEAGKKGLPVLLIGGDSDNQVNYEANLKALKPHFTDFTSKLFKHGSHAVFYDNREEFIQTVMGFAARVTHNL
jgi:pimeloyl-ACP methyl ester carboxylesterase